MYRLSFFSACALLILPVFANAATLDLVKPDTAVHAGDTFTVGVFLDTGTESVNTLGGSIYISPDLTLQEIYYSGSLVPLWISSPKETAPGTITFAGLIPGGLQVSEPSETSTSWGTIFTLILKAQQTGPASISFASDTAVYINDGSGTRAPLFAPALSFAILPRSGAPQTVVLPGTAVPPEPFTPLIESGQPYGYAGSVLVFATQDKNSGISGYDIAASYDPDPSNTDLVWQEATSPYLIPQQDADKYLFVRATDNAGNTQVEVVPPQSVSLPSLLYRWWLPLLGLIILFGVLGILSYRRRTRP